MTRAEIIQVACQIAKDPNGDWDFSSALYSAVGLIKREKDPGATMAAHKLVEEIKATGRELSLFCIRRIEIIEDEYIKRAAKNLETLAKAQEICDYNTQRRMMEREKNKMVW